MGLKIYKIDNSKKSAIKTGKWSDPGADFYNKLLNAFYCVGNVPSTPDKLEKAKKEGKYLEWYDFLKEAYMVAPVKDIKNSPYGITPYSRSGCKYPHHVLKGDKLVISIPGLRAAYICARNQGVLVNHTQENKMIIAHFNKHFKELGITPQWHHGELYFIEDTECKIEQNFRDIYQTIMEQTGINLFDDYDEIDEASHGKLKYDFRMGWDYNTGHQIKVVYSLDNINITDVGNFYYDYDGKKVGATHDSHLDYTRKNIAKKGVQNI